MTVKAVGFDLDDTLYSRKRIYKNVFNTMQNSVVKLNISFHQFFQKYLMFSNIEYENFIERKKGIKEYKNDRVIDTYEYFGKKISPEEATTFNDLHLKFKNQIEYRANVERLLKLLSTKDYALFILTNGPSSGQRKKLEHLGIEEYIKKDRWFISDELNYTKPEKEAFSIVEKSIDFKGKEILYIGDDVRNDIKGAQKMNWNTILFNAHNVKKTVEKTKTVDNFSEIIRLFKDD